MIGRLLRRLEAFLLARDVVDDEPEPLFVFDSVEPDDFRAWSMLHAESTATGFVDEISHPNADDF